MTNHSTTRYKNYSKFLFKRMVINYYVGTILFIGCFPCLNSWWKKFWRLIGNGDPPLMNILISSLPQPQLIKQSKLGIWIFSAVCIHKSIWHVTSEEEFRAQDHCCGSSPTLALLSVLMLGCVRDVFPVWDDSFTLNGL